MKNIYLIGFMGAGKSTIGARMAQMYGLEIVEMDQLIAKREGMGITEIFSQKGEPYFRERESGLLKEIGLGNNKIVSCGGGVVLCDENVQCMKKSGSIVLLNAKPNTILERINGDDSRPLLYGTKTVESIEALMMQRKNRYECTADYAIQTDGKTVDAICKEIFDKIGE